MFVIGVGAGVTDALSALRIQAVSGTKSFPTYPISTADYTLVTDFDELEDALGDIASNLCSVVVTVKKETDEVTRDVWVSKPNWTFSGRTVIQPTADPFSYAWFEPRSVDPVDTNTATQSGPTDGGGNLRFVWRPKAADSLSNITVSETPPSAYTPAKAWCTSDGVTIFSSEVPAVVASFTLMGLKVRDKVDCTVRNRLKRSSVRVVKQWIGTPSSAAIFVDRNGDAPYDASTVATTSGVSTSFDYPVSTPVFLGEVTVPTGYTATIDCGSGPQAYAGGAFAVTAPATDGDTLTCTITNTQLRSTVQVVKQWDGVPASATIFVDQDGVAPFNASTVATVDGASASFTYPLSTAVNVGEVAVPAGYSATIDCGPGPVPYAGGPYAVNAPDIPNTTLTCTITNKQKLSTVQIVKQWDGAPASATIFVDQDGVAPYDASTVATADGDSTSFTYPVSTPVNVGETAVPTGYSATIDCGQGPQPYTGGAFPVTAPAGDGATLTCTVTNRQLFSIVQIVKQWSGTPASATIFVDQDGVAPYDASTVATADGDSTSFTYPVSTPVNVGETAVPTGYSATIDCGQGPQPYTGGAFPVTAPATGGATLTCTVTNIIVPPLLATVQIVKQWDGAPASATIFVDQDGVAPFDASTVATADGDSASFEYVVSTPVNVGETAVPTGYSATIDCGQGPQPYTGGAFPVTAPAEEGATLTCTVTNRQQLSTVQIVKQWDGAPASATIFVDQDGVAPFDASTVATADGDSTSFTYPVSTPVNVGETAVPTGYSATIDCGQGPQPYTGGAFPVTAPAGDGATLTCTVTNRQLFSIVQIVKQWSGTPASATIFVDQDGVAPYDASTVATADGDSTSFTYPVSTPVNVGEVAVPAGYEATIHCGRTREAPLPYGGGPFQVESPNTDGATLTCTIRNIQLRSTVQVVKEWAGAASSATIFVDADGSAPYDASTVATVSGQYASATYPVSTPATLGESPVPTGFRATIDCGAGQQAYSGGPFAVTSPAAAGATLTCTITNTPVTTVRVEKVWEGGRAPSGAELFVDGTGQAPLDATTIATSDGESVSFDYPPSTQVTLGEIAVPRGYRSFIDCGNGPREIRRYSGGPFTVTSPATPNGVLTCTVANVKQAPLARLVIRKRASKHVFRRPGRVGFTITVRNRGPGIARAVIACDQFPRGLRFILARPEAEQRAGRICWRVGRLNPRAKRTFFVVARVAGVKRPHTYLNVVDVEGANASNCPRLVGASARQRPACVARARVVALPPRKGVLGARITFTG